MAFVCRHPNVSGGGRKTRLVRRRRRRHPGFCATGRRAGYLSAQRSKSLGHRILTDLKNLGLWLRLCGQAVSLVRRVLVWSSICWLDPGESRHEVEDNAPKGDYCRDRWGDEDCETRPRPSGCLPFFPHDERCSASGRSFEEMGDLKPSLFWKFGTRLVFPPFPPSPLPPSFFLTVRPPASRRMDATATGGAGAAAHHHARPCRVTCR